MRYVWYALFMVIMMPGLLKADKQFSSFHAAYWTKDGHRDQSNGLIEKALTTPAMYSYQEDANIRIVSHKVCEGNACATLRFQYRFEAVSQGQSSEALLSELEIVLYSHDGSVQWKRHTSFHDHDAQGASRSWPLRSAETLFDGSQKEVYYRWSLGYGECVLNEKYQLHTSTAKIPVISWLRQERIHWDNTVQRYGHVYNMKMLYDDERIDSDSKGVVRLDDELMEDGLYRIYKKDMLIMVQIEKSRIEGKIYAYLNSGTLMAEGNFLHGKEDGKQIEYFDNTQKKVEEFYHQGKKEGEQFAFYENGAIKDHGNYRDGKPEGKQIAYYANAHKKREYSYHQGKKEGEQYAFYESGVLRLFETYRDGKFHGKRRRYYEDGTLKEELTFMQGTLNGGMSHYYPNGQLRSKGLHIDGKRQGITTHYDEKGRPVYEEIYRDGRLSERYRILPDGVKEFIPAD